jgi:hypothetical protein
MPRQHLYDNPKSPEFTLGALRTLLAYVRAQQADGRTKITNFSEGRGGSLKTFKTLIDQIEEDTGTYMVGRVLENPLTGSEQGDIAAYPEELDGPAEALKAAYKKEVTRTRKSTVTLDGEVWAEFAEVVLGLYEITRRATNRRPLRKEPVQVARGPFAGLRPTRAVVPENVPPTRHSEEDRRRYLVWLKHQSKLVAEARAFCDADDGSVHELLRFVPGYEPEERPPYDEFETADPVRERHRNSEDEAGYPSAARR